MRIFTRLLGACVAMLVLSDSATAQSFKTSPVEGQFRDVLISPESGALYAAVYSDNVVLRFDPVSLDVTGRAETGKGPAAVALSANGSYLAVVNRLDATVTIVSLPAFETAGAVATGEGPAGVAALPNGQFVVANGFGDSLTLIDPSSLSVVRTVEGFSAVPAAVAVSGETLAVAVREPARVELLDAVSFTSQGTVALPGAPQDLSALDGGRFAVATDGGVLVFDRTGAISARDDAPAGHVASDGESLYLSVDGALHRADATLSTRTPVAASGEVWGVRAAPGAVAVFSPRARTLAVSAEPSAIAEAPEQPQEAPAAPVVVEAEPAEPRPEPEVETPPAPEAPVVEEAEPLPPPEEPMVEEAEPLPAPEAPMVEEAEPLPAPEDPVVEEAEPVEAPSVEKAAPVEAPVASPEPERPAPLRPATDPERRPSARRPDNTPIAAMEPRVPSASPLARAEGPESLTSALAEGAAIDSTETGFSVPDLSGGIEDVSADYLDRPGDGSVAVMEGNVKGRIGDATIATDSMRIDETNSTVEATGNVVITQQESVLHADRVKYQAPPPEAIETPGVRLIPIEQQEQTAQERLRMGIIEGENIHLVEPTREVDAEYIKYDMATRTGEVRMARGRAGVMYFSADELHLHGPQSMEGRDVWVTTCDLPTPHYRIRLRSAKLEEGKMALGSNARLQLGKADTPVYVPQWRSSGYRGDRNVSWDFDSGHDAELGYYVNVGRWWEVSKDFDAAIRLFPTTREGVGFGVDAEYDYMETPASPFFRSKGSFRSLYTTEDRGYTEWYHRHEVTDDTIVLGQFEQWYDEDFVKDFYYDIFRNRTGPRSFANVTHTQNGWLATGTVAVRTHDFTRETEKLPEATFHLLERPLGNNFYFTFDSYAGYYERPVLGIESARFVNVARLSYDWNVAKGFNLTPFVQLDGSWYSDLLDDEDSDSRFSSVAGVTAQARFQRAYAGRWGFSGFKHIVVPSVTYSYRPDARIDAEDTPQFDALDQVPGRSRIESKIDNVVLGRDAETGETWQVARVSFYQGNDFSNETRKSEDYEIEFDIRPRPWWGFQAVAERHSLDDKYDRRFFGDGRYLARIRNNLIEEFGESRDFLPEGRGDFDRVLSYLYYDDTTQGGNFNGRVGFAYTETEGRVFNREILYGMGYRVNDQWGFAFEHRYDLDRGELVRQTYELRRRLHCWEAAFQFRDRESGFDVGFELSLTAFPGTKLKF